MRSSKKILIQVSFLVVKFPARHELLTSGLSYEILRPGHLSSGLCPLHKSTNAYANLAGNPRN